MPSATIIHSTLLPLPSYLLSPFTQFFWRWRAWAFWRINHILTL
jgi:hypothetical protein